MKTKLTMMAACGLLLFSTAAYAGDGLYVGLGVGIAYHQSRIYDEKNYAATRWSFKEGRLFDGYVGYRSGLIKGEVELDHTSYAAESRVAGATVIPMSGNLQRTSAMANLMAVGDFNSWELFGGAGMGMSSIKWNVTTSVGSMNSTKSAFSYQLIAGANYVINESTSFGIRYRYMDGQDYQPVDSTGTAAKFSFPAAHLVTANMEFRFN